MNNAELLFQFYTTERRMQILGPNGLASQDEDDTPKTVEPEEAERLEIVARYPAQPPKRDPDAHLGATES